MAQDVTATHWVSQSPDRVTAIHERGRMLTRVTVEDHFRRLVLAWAETDDGVFPSRSQAQVAAHYELEVLCGWLGRFAALAPDEVFPRQGHVTIPQELDEGW